MAQEVSTKHTKRSKGHHHWAVESTVGYPLPDKLKVLYPNTILRRAVCKLCGKKTFLKEQLF